MGSNRADFTWPAGGFFRRGRVRARGKDIGKPLVHRLVIRDTGKCRGRESDYHCSDVSHLLPRFESEMRAIFSWFEEVRTGLFPGGRWTRTSSTASREPGISNVLRLIASHSYRFARWPSGDAACRAFPASGQFCHGERPTIADICLVTQVTPAMIFNLSLDPYPRVMRVYNTCMAIPAFADAPRQSSPKRNRAVRELRA
jgi:glutathione S-transferase